MDFAAKERLAHTGDMGKAASAIRLRGARHCVGLSQIDLAKQVAIKKTTYNNMEQALAFPSRDVMRWFYRLHRIDFNFLMNGDFAQLPSDVSDRLFAALAVANNEWDRRQD
jgi:ribosome-binding protein aMBF1 (putative translation factor)